MESLKQSNSKIKVYVLPAQEDIANFEAGQRPTNLLVRDFANEAELVAYKDGLDCIEDEFDEIDGLNVVGCKVSFTRETDPDDDADIVELIFDTEGEAQSCHEGIGDAEGMHAPLVVEPEDDGYEKLAAYEAEGPEVATQDAQATFSPGQRFTFQPGDQVVCNGYPGSVARMYGEGMVEVRVPGGLTCVSASYPDCYPSA